MSISSDRIVKKFLVFDENSNSVIDIKDTLDDAVSRADDVYQQPGGYPNLLTVIESYRVLPPA
ncbi:hypothetical protein OHV08_34165 [Streptomyces canus]|uniref:hypothetical protein n=1 Tax=Streptomyces canus TaxID=58343 RepID=UPI003253A618